MGDGRIGDTAAFEECPVEGCGWNLTSTSIWEAGDLLALHIQANHEQCSAGSGGLQCVMIAGHEPLDSQFDHNFGGYGPFTPRAREAVDHPAHYNQHPSGVECITVVEWMTFNLGNAVEYVWRAGEKSADPIEDLRKARWYLDREIARLEGGKDAGTAQGPIPAVEERTTSGGPGAAAPGGEPAGGAPAILATDPLGRYGPHPPGWYPTSVTPPGYGRPRPQADD